MEPTCGRKRSRVEADQGDPKDELSGRDLLDLRLLSAMPAVQSYVRDKRGRRGGLYVGDMRNAVVDALAGAIAADARPGSCAGGDALTFISLQSSAETAAPSMEKGAASEPAEVANVEHAEARVVLAPAGDAAAPALAVGEDCLEAAPAACSSSSSSSAPSPSFAADAVLEC